MTHKKIDLNGLVLPEREGLRFSPRHDPHSGQLHRVPGTFVIEPLERGFGHTLGNAMRRVLLSSLRGAAVWGFRVTGVMHEHQTIDGVVEDVHEVIQNLKSLPVALSPDVSKATLRLGVNKPGAVTAADIAPTSGVRILNEKHHICTLQDKRDLHFDLYVNTGRGFVLSDQHPEQDNLPVDLVRIDSVYNPVTRANFRVEETRVGQRTDFDRLTIDLETDGSVSPETALAYAADLVSCHLEYLSYFGTGRMPKYSAPGATPVTEVMRERLMSSLDKFPQIPVRARNNLKGANITTMRQLVAMTEEEVLQVDKLGKKLLTELVDAIGTLGFTLNMRFEERLDGRLFLLRDDPDAESGNGAPGEGMKSMDVNVAASSIGVG